MVHNSVIDSKASFLECNWILISDMLVFFFFLNVLTYFFFLGYEHFSYSLVKIEFIPLFHFHTVFVALKLLK